MIRLIAPNVGLTWLPDYTRRIEEAIRSVQTVSVSWGDIGGTLADQTDLQSALLDKVPTTRTVSTTSPLSGGGALSDDLTLGLADTAVAPGIYTYSSITVDAKGRLTAAASGAGPAWVVAASWAWSTNVANVDLTGLGGYSELLIMASGLACSSSTDRFVRVSTDGGSTFHSTGYSLLAANGTVTSGTVAGATSGSTTAAASLVVHIPGSNINGAIKTCHTLHVPAVRLFSGSLSPIDAIRVAPSAGNLTAGSITVLGRP